MATEQTPAPGNEAPAVLLQQKNITVKGIFASELTQKKFREMLGQKAQGFITSLLQIASTGDLALAEPWSVYYAACSAATMDLPINQNLGFAWIIGYKKGYDGPVMAQFQMGYKGYNQLALRTGQYARLNNLPVYGNQFKSWNEMSEELVADFSVEGVGEPVGYLAYFKLINGFEKTVYWSRDKVVKHAKKYSKSFDNPKGKWRTDFDAMALKTVLKHALSRWGILSIEMQRAILVDQAVILDEEGTTVDFVDNPEDSAEDKAKAAAKSTESKLNKKSGNPLQDTASTMFPDDKKGE